LKKNIKSDIKRDILKTNNKIELLNMASGGTEVFTIKTVIGQGGSSVCYRASRGRVNGLLKEFYPRDFNDNYNFLERNKKNQLVARGNGYSIHFKEMCNDFCESIHLLSKVNFNKESNVLNNYIPSFEIFKGTDDNSTVYVWCKENLGDTFSDYITSVRKAPKKNGGFKLYNILTTIKTISVSIVAMHKNGLLHRDIKPENFLLFKDGLGNVNPNNISVFDINSFSYGSRSKFIVGTEGYKAPEVDKGKANYYSDIYSIGAMIFSALTGRLYNDEFYNYIGEYIENAELMEAADVYLKTRIINILKKTLAVKPNMRYETTEELVEELDKAIVRLLPETYSKKLDSNQTLKIIENKKPVDAIPLFQNLLYKMPVYKWFPRDSEEINVLVIGGGVYAQAFTDAALQTLQMKGKKLSLTIVSDSAEYDKQIYLKYRPDLERFFSIDRKYDENAYGRLRFLEMKLEKNKESVNKLISKTNPCYVLVSLGDDELNHSIAKLIVDTKIKACVNFVWSGADEQKFAKGNPVYINSGTEYKKLDKELLKMAFNTHLVWNDAIDADIERLYNEFRKSYNYKSSIAFALSIPYKLHSLNITPEEVIKNPKILSFEDDITDELSWLEHRRWVTEKITSGWQAPVDENGRVLNEKCIEFNDNKSQKEKLHLCICRSELNKKKLPEDGKEWDICDKESLDELDRMSIEVYRHFKRRAMQIKEEYFIRNKSRISEIRKWIPCDNAKLIKLFNAYELAINAVVFENSSLYSAGFKALHKRLIKEIENNPGAYKTRIIHVLDEIYEKIQPAIFANKKTDYKALDEKLVKAMAYIMSNVPRPGVVMIFNDGRYNKNTDIFKNVASLSVIIPGRVKYLCRLDENTDVERLISGIKGVMSYFDSKQLKSKTEFVFASNKAIGEAFKDNIKSILEENVKYYENKENDDIISIFSEEASECELADLSSLPFEDDRDNKKFAEKLSLLPCFEFDNSKMIFKIISVKNHMNIYDTSKAKLMVSDIFTLKNEAYECNSPDFFGFYREMWEIYKENTQKGQVMYWNSLCEKLKTFSEENDVPARITKKTGKQKRLTKILPGYCYENVKLISEELVKNGFAESSAVYILNSDSIKIDILSDDSEIEKLFSKYHILKDKIHIITQKNGTELTIAYNNLAVSHIKLNKKELDCLNKLADYGFINDLKVSDNGSVGFLYASESIKKVLTEPGAIPKLHIYYEALNSGAFDDVALDVFSQDRFIDMIITKDNKSVFVACGFGKKIDSLYRDEIKEYAVQYGINGSTMIITDCADTDCCDALKILSAEDFEKIGDKLINYLRRN